MLVNGDGEALKYGTPLEAAAASNGSIRFRYVVVLPRIFENLTRNFSSTIPRRRRRLYLTQLPTRIHG